MAQGIKSSLKPWIWFPRPRPWWKVRKNPLSQPLTSTYTQQINVKKVKKKKKLCLIVQTLNSSTMGWDRGQPTLWNCHKNKQTKELLIPIWSQDFVCFLINSQVGVPHLLVLGLQVCSGTAGVFYGSWVGRGFLQPSEIVWSPTWAGNWVAAAVCHPLERQAPCSLALIFS